MRRMLFSVLPVSFHSVQAPAQHTAMSDAPSAASAAAPVALCHPASALAGPWNLRTRSDVSVISITRMAVMKEAIV